MLLPAAIHPRTCSWGSSDHRGHARCNETDNYTRFQPIAAHAGPAGSNDSNCYPCPCTDRDPGHPYQHARCQYPCPSSLPHSNSDFYADTHTTTTHASSQPHADTHASSESQPHADIHPSSQSQP